LNELEPTEPQSRNKTRTLLIVMGAFLILAGRLFWQVSHYAVNIFFSDQWDFYNATLFEKHTLGQMFRWQHGPHRLGLGALLSVVLEPYFHWNSRAEAFLATTIIVVAALFALYLKTRLYGALSILDTAIPIIFFTPAQYESLWVTPDFAHGPLPLLLIVLYVLALSCARTNLRYALVLFINFVAIYTGFALLIGLVTPLWLVCEYYSNHIKDQLDFSVPIALLLSLASLGSFFAGYRFDPAAACFVPLPHSATYLTFFLGMLAHNLGARGPQIISIPLGAAILAAMVFALRDSARKLWEPKTYAAIDSVPAVLIAFSLLFCVATAYGRSCLGSHLAFESRYTNYLSLGMLGLYFYFHTLSLRDGKLKKTFVGLLLALILFGSVETHPADRYAMGRFHQIKATWRNCYLTIGDVNGCDQKAGFWIYPFPERTHLKEKLGFLKTARLNLYAEPR
jgi:hypothetical protein